MPRPRHGPAPLGLGALLALGACSTGATDEGLRQAWLVDAITDDNRIWFSRPSGPLATKYARMAADPYDYMRGTGGVSFVDWARSVPDRRATLFVEASGSETLLLIGDPHPENLGTYLPGDAIEPTSRLEPILLHLEPNDFDGSSYGPWVLDVRRAAQGLAVLLHQAHCDAACREPILVAWAEAYADELDRIAADQGQWHPGLAGSGTGILDRLVQEATEEGLHRERLVAWTRTTTNGLAMRFDSKLDGDGRGTLPLTLEEQAQLDRLLAAYRPHAPSGFRVFDAGRRYGSGIASVPAIRYAVAFDRGQDGPEDDGILQVREVVDPPQAPGLLEDPVLLFDSNATRVDGAARTFWHHPETDPLSAGLTDGQMAFKAVTGSSFSEGLDHLDIVADVTFAPAKEALLVELADSLARVLASAHANSSTWAGDPALPILRSDLEGRGARFVAEVVQTAEADLEQTLTDHRLFAAALDELGPLLGAERMGVR